MNSQNNNHSSAPSRRRRSTEREAEELEEANYIFGEHAQPILVEDSPPSLRRTGRQPPREAVNDNAVDAPSASGGGDVAAPQNVNVSRFFFLSR